MEHKKKSLNNILAEKYPALAKQWHPTKNGNLTPDMVTSGSNKKVWWICERGHEWEARIASRTTQGSGCPFCAGLTVIKGVNDIATTHPEIAKQWHPTKNSDLKPTDIATTSHKKVWWICEHGHEWFSSPANRVKCSGNGCPVCAGKMILRGYNDLSSMQPDLAKEWHPTKNGDLTPDMVTSGSNKKVWWMCKLSHEWEATVNSRTLGCSCPYCTGTKVLKGFNDLATLYPDIAAQWHPTKNGDLTPDMITSGSSKKVWWQCKHDHVWKKSVVDMRNLAECPICKKIRKKDIQK